LEATRTTGSSSLMKGVNTQLVLRTIMECGPLSRADIAEQTTLSPPTVSRIVRELLDLGTVQTAGVSSGRRGTPATLIRFNESSAYVMGIDVGELKIRGALANLMGDSLAYAELPTLNEAGYYVTVNNLTKLIHKLMVEAGVDSSKLTTIIVGVPGTVDDEGTVIEAPNIKGWVGFPLRGILANSLPCPITIENDINLAVLGEHWIGAARDKQTVAFVSIKTGIGAGLLVNGSIHRGAHHHGGEIGFMVVSDQDLDESRKCHLEAQASAHAMGKKAVQAIRSGRCSIISKMIAPDSEVVEMEVICQAALEKDPLAMELIDEQGEYVGRAVANLVNLFDPEITVIGGEFNHLGQVLLERIQQTVYKYVPFEPEIVLSHLGSQAVVQGALCQALKKGKEVLLGQFA
jgi:glucokinase